MIISIIVAVSNNNVIGANNKLLWHLSDDLKNFKKITTGSTVLMGRKTFESIGKVLPNRENIVISKNQDLNLKDANFFDSIEKALDYCKEKGKEEVFVIGGGEIYKETLPLAQKLYYTQVKTILVGDTFFPEIKWKKWEVLEKKNFEKNEKNDYAFTFLALERKS